MISPDNPYWWQVFVATLPGLHSPEPITQPTCYCAPRPYCAVPVFYAVGHKPDEEWVAGGRYGSRLVGIAPLPKLMWTSRRTVIHLNVIIYAPIVFKREAAIKRQLHRLVNKKYCQSKVCRQCTCIFVSAFWPPKKGCFPLDKNTRKRVHFPGNNNEHP